MLNHEKCAEDELFSLFLDRVVKMPRKFCAYDLWSLCVRTKVREPFPEPRGLLSGPINPKGKTAATVANVDPQEPLPAR